MKKIVLLSMIISVLAACQPKQDFKESEARKCNVQRVDKETLTDILYGGDFQDIQFIDIRTPHEYAGGHLPGAVNIPFKNFFDEKYQSQIKPDKILIVYGNGSDAQLAAMMGFHFRYLNMYTIPAGYDFIRDKIMNRYAVYSGVYDDEVLLVDFKEALKEIAQKYGAGQVKTQAPKPKAALPAVKRKKKEVTGGCG